MSEKFHLPYHHSNMLYTSFPLNTASGTRLSFPATDSSVCSLEWPEHFGMFADV